MSAEIGGAKRPKTSESNDHTQIWNTRYIIELNNKDNDLNSNNLNESYITMLYPLDPWM